MRLSTGHTFPCTRHRQFLFCPGDPDITKSPLFFQILIVVRSDRHIAWEQTVFHSDQIDMRKFQPLCAVQCHQNDIIRISSSESISATSATSSKTAEGRLHLLGCALFLICGDFAYQSSIFSILACASSLSSASRFSMYPVFSMISFIRSVMLTSSDRRLKYSINATKESNLDAARAIRGSDPIPEAPRKIRFPLLPPIPGSV